jgi:hypothetical protein
MQINIKVDTFRFNDLAKNYPRNLAYSTAQALNDTARDAQDQIRDEIAQHFHVRSSRTMGLLRRSIKIMAFANVRSNRPYAILGVDNKPRLLLSMFEEGGRREPWVGRRAAVPRVGSGGARASIESPINSAWLIKSLNMHKGPTVPRKTLSSNPRNVRRRSGNRSNYQFWQGASQTFMLERTKRAAYGGIFRRVEKGAGDGAIKMLYSFRPQVPVPAVLEFYTTAGRVFASRFTAHLDRRFYRLRGVGG